MREFRPLAADAVQALLHTGWAPHGVTLPRDAFGPELLAAIILITGGSFRLLNRLLTQIERILALSDAQTVSLEIVEAARESLVIGQAWKRKTLTLRQSSLTTCDS